MCGRGRRGIHTYRTMHPCGVGAAGKTQVGFRALQGLWHVWEAQRHSCSSVSKARRSSSQTNRSPYLISDAKLSPKNENPTSRVIIDTYHITIAKSMNLCTVYMMVCSIHSDRSSSDVRNHFQSLVQYGHLTHEPRTLTQILGKLCYLLVSPSEFRSGRLVAG